MFPISQPFRRVSAFAILFCLVIIDVISQTKGERDVAVITNIFKIIIGLSSIYIVVAFYLKKDLYVFIKKNFYAVGIVVLILGVLILLNELFLFSFTLYFLLPQLTLAASFFAWRAGKIIENESESESNRRKIKAASRMAILSFVISLLPLLNVGFSFLISPMFASYLFFLLLAFINLDIFNKKVYTNFKHHYFKVWALTLLAGVFLIIYAIFFENIWPHIYESNRTHIYVHYIYSLYSINLGLSVVVACGGLILLSDINNNGFRKNTVILTISTAVITTLVSLFYLFYQSYYFGDSERKLFLTFGTLFGVVIYLIIMKEQLKAESS